MSHQNAFDASVASEMAIGVVRYQSGYRFRLKSAFRCQTGIKEACAGNEFVGLDAAGWLTIAAGYAWDGCSGPLADDATTIRGSLVHDALYALMREHGLSPTWREAADDLLRDLFVEDGLHHAMAGIAHAAVRAFGGAHIDPANARPVLTAPEPLTFPPVEYLP